MLPVCRAMVACGWAAFEVCMPLSRQRSSACRLSSGKSELMGSPLFSPRGELELGGEKVARFAVLAAAALASVGLQVGFQSKVFEVARPRPA